ncbi:hypothetical protein [Microvirga massiliensis]|uniref:hypothetical protein n=1 Tax=Microvirga massiliensis TaxID=1033741 RepID=UPI00062BB116|nr:hypothetical protein [Microvirga massiliensis]
MIFISHTTGKPLSKEYFTNVASAAFRADGVKATFHRIRARFLSRIVEECLDDEIERSGYHYSTATVLNRAAELARHSNLASLKYYLRLARKRRARQTSAQRAHELQERELSARRSLAFGEQSLRGLAAAKKLIQAVRNGDPAGITTARAKLDAELDELLTTFRTLPH